MRKMKQTDLAMVRDELCEAQKWKCPICGGHLKMITKVNRVVDHDHNTGVVRACLCRGCNGGIGKIEAYAQSYCKAGNNTREVIKVLRNLADYLEHHQIPRTGWIYHKHQTEAEKREARNRKARLAYAKKKAGGKVG